MKQTISYKDMPQEEADLKSIEDTKFYLGKDGWKKVCNMIEEYKPDFNNLAIMLEFQGVRGYPVFAIARHFKIEIPKTQENGH